jgi:short-subunit dehydrogenase
MISRNSVKLEASSKKVLEVNSKVQVRTFEFNFNRPYSPEAYKPLYDILDEIKDISVLVNNVGYGPRLNAQFHEYPIDLITTTFQLNTIPMLYVTQYCLKLMVAREKRSAIINVSSIAKMFKAYESHIYSSSKSFSSCMMDCLKKAPAYKNVDFLDLLTASVKSNMNDGKLVLTVDADSYAKSSLKHLGYEFKEHGHWKHNLFICMIFNPLTMPFMFYNILNSGDSLGNIELQAPVKE